MKTNKMCPICEKPNTEKTGQCCSKECSLILRKRNCIAKYGVEHPLQTREVKEKVKQTMIEKHGGFTLQSKELKEKVKQTNLEKYRSNKSWTI